VVEFVVCLLRRWQFLGGLRLTRKYLHNRVVIKNANQKYYQRMKFLELAQKNSIDGCFLVRNSHFLAKKKVPDETDTFSKYI